MSDALNITLQEYAGDSFARTVTVKDSDGNAVDLTGWTFYLTIKEEKTDADGDAVFQNSYTAATPSSGQVDITLDASDTDDLLGDYWYDIRYKDDTGFVDTILNGVFRFDQNITETLA